MRRCLQLAQRGVGFVSPNPLVGCVIVHQGKIIGEGYHRCYGEAHAEVNAIAAVKQPELLAASTLYVNLEPCAHFGKTPPCADLIIEKNIPRIVIANRDPFHAVDGKGIDKLTKAGREVVYGVCEEEGRQLNQAFFTYHLKKRPYITLKWAQTSDGFIDRLRSANENQPFWISSPATRKLVHLWRTQIDAILVGSRTALIDNPELTARDASGRQPVRILLDPEHAIDVKARIFNSSAKTFYFSRTARNLPVDIQQFKLFDDQTLGLVLETLYEEGIQHLLVEGGAYTLNHFIEQNLWDEARVIVGPRFLERGIEAPRIDNRPVARQSYAGDELLSYRNL